MEEHNNKIIDPIQIEVLKMMNSKELYPYSLEFIYKCFGKINFYNLYISDFGFATEFTAYLRRDDKPIDFIMKTDENYVKIPWFSLNGFGRLCKHINDKQSIYIY
jgi:hypothetical protein